MVWIRKNLVLFSWRFITGFLLGSVPWYIGVFILVCAKINPREKPGYIACAIAVSLPLYIVHYKIQSSESCGISKLSLVFIGCSCYYCHSVWFHGRKRSLVLRVYHQWSNEKTIQICSSSRYSFVINNILIHCVC